MTSPADDAKLIERLWEIAALVRVYEMLAKDEAERIDEAADRLAALSEENERMKGALWGIAKQQTTYELEGDDGDFEEGYDAIIKVARAALSPTPAAGAGTSLES